jgi:hypothetical protein
MSSPVEENCSRRSEAPPCDDCVDIQTRMLVYKAHGGFPDLPDGQRKVIRKMLALAEKERVLRSSRVHLVAHFLAEYTKLYRDDSIEEWVRFEKSYQCRAMGESTFPLFLSSPHGGWICMVVPFWSSTRNKSSQV